MGEKKDTQMSMPKGYLPKFVEAAWYEWWDKCGFFAPDLKSGELPAVPFSALLGARWRFEGSHLRRGALAVTLTRGRTAWT